ncbi:MAG TPA: acyl-CoA dehydrogenase family protein [Gaiellaceae bacterium]|nr:acyl-CoA dehydrogenase family protein [Gaiellaceae bacterium]
MIPTVPELPAEIQELKARVAAFLETEVYPVEQRVAEAGRIDSEWVTELRRKSWAEGFAMLNMPEEAGGRGLSMLGQVALEEESGKATNGLGFVAVDRGPAELWDIATPGQREQFVGPVLRGEYREAWAVTEPGAGSDVSALVTTAERDEDEWVLNGEKWFVTSEGDPGFYLVLAVAEGEQALFIVEPWRTGLEITKTPSFLHDPYLDHHPEIVLTNCRVPEENRIPEGGGEGAREWFLVERLFIAARCCGAAQRSLELARAFALEREAFGTKIAEHQGVSFQLADSLTELLAARLLTYHAAAAFDSEPDRRVVHGKVAMAKLYASEAAGRIVDRALQVLGGRGYMLESPVARFYREVRVDRIWEGTSEIQRLIVSRGLLKRGVDTYLC